MLTRSHITYHLYVHNSPWEMSHWTCIGNCLLNELVFFINHFTARCFQPTWQKIYDPIGWFPQVWGQNWKNIEITQDSTNESVYLGIFQTHQPKNGDKPSSPGTEPVNCHRYFPMICLSDDWNHGETTSLKWPPMTYSYILMINFLTISICQEEAIYKRKVSSIFRSKKCC